MSTSLPLPVPSSGAPIGPQINADPLASSPLSTDLNGEFGAHLASELNAKLPGQHPSGGRTGDQASPAAVTGVSEDLPVDGKRLPFSALLDTEGGLNIQLAGGDQTLGLSLQESGAFSFSYSDGEGVEGFGIQLSATTESPGHSALTLALADKKHLLAVNVSEANLAQPATVINEDSAEAILASDGLQQNALLNIPSQAASEQLAKAENAIPAVELAQSTVVQAQLDADQGALVQSTIGEDQAGAVIAATSTEQSHVNQQQTTPIPTEATIPAGVERSAETANPVPVSKQAEIAQQYAAPVRDETGRVPGPAVQAEVTTSNPGSRTGHEGVVQKPQGDQVATNNASIPVSTRTLNEQTIRNGQLPAQEAPASSRTDQQVRAEQPVERESLILKNNEFRRLQNLFEPVRQQIDAATNTAQVSRVADQLGETVQRVITPPPAVQTSPLLPATPVTDTSLSSSTSGLTQLSVDVPLQNDKWQQAFSQRVVWSIGNAQSAQLKIHPAELGMIDIKLSMADDQANVVFNTQHGAVKDAIESALPRLREMLAEQGLNLGDVDVREEGKPDQQAAADQDGQQQGVEQGSNTGNSDTDEGHELVTAFQVDDDSVDYYV